MGVQGENARAVWHWAQPWKRTFECGDKASSLARFEESPQGFGLERPRQDEEGTAPDRVRAP